MEVWRCVFFPISNRIKIWNFSQRSQQLSLLEQKVSRCGGEGNRGGNYLQGRRGCLLWVLKKKNWEDLKLASIVLMSNVEKPQNYNFLYFITFYSRIFTVWFHQTLKKTNKHAVLISFVSSNIWILLNSWTETQIPWKHYAFSQAFVRSGIKLWTRKLKLAQWFHF